MLNIRNFIPEGVEDTGSRQYEIKENLIRKIKRIYKSYGYRGIQTPSFEYFDLFSNLEGTINKDEMFKLIDCSGKILVLRPDATIPIARLAAASYKNNKCYLKFCYVTNIFRINYEESGLKREFTQAGVEYLGSDSKESDAEVIALGIETLMKCGIKNFKIDIGQAGYFKGLVKESGISEENEELIRKLIEDKNFTELNDMLKNLNISDTLKNTILKIPYLYGTPEKVIEEAKGLICNEDMKASLDNLIQVYEILKDYRYEKYISVDLGLVNHIHYYTGILFKGYVSNYGRAVLSGGRYDNLTQQYGYYMPATGFGLNIDELMEVVEMNKISDETICCTDYLVLYKDDQRKDALELAAELREKGFIVECDSARDIVSHIKNAEARNIKEIVKLSDAMVSVISIGNNENYKMKPAQFLKSIEDKEVVIPIH
ncbi:MAG: hisZ [Clostridiales bacterium]|nr:hisZ [Clostridiales bacterium]